MRKIILAVIYIVEILKYYIGYYLCFDEKIKGKWYSWAGVLLGLAGILWFDRGDDIESYLFLCACIWILLFLSLERGKSKRIFRAFFTIFLVTCVSETIGLILELVNLCLGLKCKVDLYQDLKIDLLALVLFVVMLLIKRRILGREKNDFYIAIREKIQYMVVLAAIGMMLTISGLDFAQERLGDAQFSVDVVIVCIVSYLGIGILGLFSMYVKSTNQKMEEAVQRETELKEMQKKYYETLLEKEEDTRRYRHDMLNHFICMNALADEQDFAGLKKYLLEMQGQIEEIQKKSYVTGNKLLDVITNYYLGVLDEDVDIFVSKGIEREIQIEDAKLCTVYANLLQNAVEELSRDASQNGRFIEVRFLQGREYLQMEIKNSLSEENRNGEVDDSQVTWKDDKKNHGLGLQNVQKTIDDLGGRLEIKRGTDTFEVNVIMRDCVPLNKLSDR